MIYDTKHIKQKNIKYQDMKKFPQKVKTKIQQITIQWVLFFIKIFSKMELWLNRHNNPNPNPNPNGYEDLTPTSNGDEDRKYSAALEWALKTKNIKN